MSRALTQRYQPADTQATDDAAQIALLSVRDVFPSPENDRLYRPINLGDPEFQRFAENIRETGIQAPLIVSADRYIISGHRRYAAAEAIGLEVIPCIVREDVDHDADADGFVKLLAQHNEQGVKSHDELIREAIVLTDPDKAVQDWLYSERRWGAA